MPKKKSVFGFLFGNPKRRKTRVGGYTSEFKRNLDADAYKRMGFRVRKYKRVI